MLRLSNFLNVHNSVIKLQHLVTD
uniref:Uncharacterized protein n=1 Tax=Arundo donax TaxID=35708 RepID=A0A0A8ZHW7_ARUDO